MALECNAARGEVLLRVGKLSKDGKTQPVEVVIAAEMGRLAAVSTALECKSLGDLFTRLTAVEPAATIAGIRFLTIRGDAEAAIAELKLRDFTACADAFAKALSTHFDGDEGNVEAVDEAATNDKK